MPLGVAVTRGTGGLVVVAGLVGSADVASTLLALGLGAGELVPGTALLIGWLGGPVGLAVGKVVGLLAATAVGVGVERLASGDLRRAWVGWLVAAGWAAMSGVAAVANVAWIVGR